jgi:hypothetical protein
MTYSNPHTHMALARARQEDMMREARKHELARLVPKRERGGLVAWVAGRLHRRERRSTAPAAV